MKKISLLLFASLFCFFSYSQNYLLFYNFDHINENLMVNPSNPHSFRTVVGIPGVSRVSFRYNNSLFKAGDFLNDNTIGTNVKSFIDNLDEKERFNVHQNIDLLFVGFGLKKGYLSFGIQEETTFNFMIPGQMFNFLYYGNQSENSQLTFNTSNFNAEATVQVNYHIGYQHWLLDSNLIVGARFKYINGIANARFNKFNADLKTDIFEWKMNTDISMETSGYGYIDDYENVDPLGLINTGNTGYGVDLGATYLLPKMKFSVSVLNIGSIKWTQDLNKYQSKSEFVWQGVDVDENGETQDYEQVLDSLLSDFDFTEVTASSYRTKLPMQLMASYELKVHPKHAFALTYQGSVWSNNLYNNFGINYIGRWTKHFNFMMGYGKLSGGLNSFGAGFSAALGPLQLYFMSDNIWGVVKPSQLSDFNVRLGANVVIFDLSKKKIEKKLQKKEKKLQRKMEKQVKSEKKKIEKAKSTNK